MKKSLPKIVLLTVFTFVFLSVSASAAERGVVTASALRMRSAPSTDSSILTLLPAGAQVEIYESVNGWYRAGWEDYTGYLSSAYVRLSPAAESSAPVENGQETVQYAVIMGSGVNVRSAPSTDAEVLGRVNIGDKLPLRAVENGWCRVAYGDRIAFVSARYAFAGGLSTLSSGQGVVTGEAVNLRSGPGTDSEILAQVAAGQKVELISLEDGWYEVVADGRSGYISSSYVRPCTSNADAAIGAQAAELALNYLGVPYVWGGASPKGFDCSGFTLYIYAQFGYTFSHSATSQWYESGEYVDSRDDLLPGDLILFYDPAHSNGKACSHVGIYLGDNEFIHASSSGTVRISSLDENYYNTYYKGAKRIG